MTKIISFLKVAVGTTVAALAISTVNRIGAEPIYVPNYSFELPETDYVVTNMISWQTSPQDTNGTIGVFYNDPGYGPEYYITNCDGNQAAYIFAIPCLAMFQDSNSIDSTGVASHAFDAKFEIGKSYKLVTGLIGGDSGAYPGVILQMSLYYRDSSNNMVTVALTNVVYDTNVFTGITGFVDCDLDMPAVRTTDPWAGQNIGIQFMSIVPTNLPPGGDWDLDNVRLSEALPPGWTNSLFVNGQFSATLQSDPGEVVQISTSTNLINWTTLTTLTNTTGSFSFVDSSPNSASRFYLAQP